MPVPARFSGKMIFQTREMGFPARQNKIVAFSSKTAWQIREAFVIGPHTLLKAVIPGSSVVEQSTVNRSVAGSNPARGAKIQETAPFPGRGFLHFIPFAAPLRNFSTFPETFDPFFPLRRMTRCSRPGGFAQTENTLRHGTRHRIFHQTGHCLVSQ